MSDELQKQGETIIVPSSRFGDLDVPADSVIEFPGGIIGFPSAKSFIMLEHKPPFSWLQSTQDPDLAFVVVDGFEFGQQFDVKPPVGDRETDFREDDEYAILIIVTVRPDPRMTTANLKAPLFVNMRNRRGLQVIFDDPRYSTRFPLWSEEVQNSAGNDSPQLMQANSEETKK
jgi:flagellar assembly factor FliW